MKFIGIKFIIVLFLINSFLSNIKYKKHLKRIKIDVNQQINFLKSEIKD